MEAKGKLFMLATDGSEQSKNALDVPNFIFTLLNQCAITPQKQILSLSLMKPADKLIVAHIYNNAKTDLTYNFRPEYIRDTYESYLFTRVPSFFLTSVCRIAKKKKNIAAEWKI